jgi:hypothetical protein
MAVTSTNNTAENDAVTLNRRDDERRSDDSEERRSQDLESRGNAVPRRKKQRRRHIDPTTCERDYSDPEIEFMRAMDIYKRDSGRMFPTCSEVLEVIRALGYYKLNEEQLEQINLVRIEELTECEPEGEQLDEEFADI